MTYRQKMTYGQWVGIMALVGYVAVFSAEAAWAQVAPARLAAITANLERAKAVSQRLPKLIRQRLSGGARNLINLAERFDQIEPRLRQAPPGRGRLGAQLRSPDFAEGAAGFRILAPGKVSDPSTDVFFFFSRFSGFTQSETSSAWCGENVVIGFNDSGSFFESISTLVPGGLSFIGVARSTDKGASFTDLGFLNPGATTTDFLVGDPVLACSSASTFYFASVFLRSSTSDISVSKSTDGGANWGDPVSAASKDLSTHFLDKPWMVVDPTNTSRLYVTYTDIDLSAALCGLDVIGDPIPRIAIELVRSTTGGATWGAPVVIVEVCGEESFVQGSQVAVGPVGEVYVAWEAFAADFFTREIDIRKSTDNGVTFGAVVKVDDVTCVGDCSFLQGAFSNFDFPSLAVDRSGLATNGNLYIAWNDARNLNVPDALSVITGTYGYADVLVSRSTDGGATWSADPVRVNNNTEPLPSGLGTDQYQPGIAVDKSGRIGVCFYDRRNDPNNFLIDRFCASSTNAGVNWSNKKISKKNFAAITCQDFFLDCAYMGDYDGLASDFTKVNTGFIGAWGDNSLGNPDVKASRF